MVLAALLLGLTGPASAGVVSIGDPVNGNSWSQEFGASAAGGFDHLQFGLVPGSTSLFKTPIVLHDFSRSGWDQTFADRTLALADGPALTSVDFTMSYTGEYADGVQFYAELFSGSTFLIGTLLEFDDGWSATNYTDGTRMGYESAAKHTPLPAAGWLGFGFLGVAAAVRRLRRRIS